MEIERKFLIRELPKNIADFHHYEIEQGYLCTDPVIRIRRQDQDYILTYKSHGLMSREEYNLPLSKEAYEHLRPKTDCIYIEKTRYVIPIENDLKIELDIFHGAHRGLVLAEVEFPTEEMALAYQPPSWFLKEVTFSSKYHNSTLSKYPWRQKPQD